jgi:uncharacterized membrane protein (DUF106 family)
MCELYLVIQFNGPAHFFMWIFWYIIVAIDVYKVLRRDMLRSC